MVADWTVAELARRVVGAWRDGGEARFVLGIAGPPAAGKSTLAAALRDELNRLCGRTVAELAPMDGFHLPNAVLDAAGTQSLKGVPATFDADGYVAALRSLRSAGVVGWPTYDRVVRHEPVPDAILIGPEIGIVITEGNYLLLDQPPWSAVHGLLDQVWYLDAGEGVRVDRLRERHSAMGKTAAQVERKIAETDLPNANLVATTRSQADLILG